MSLVVGVDPGLATGAAVALDAEGGQRWLECAREWRTRPQTCEERRWLQVAEVLSHVILDLDPDVVAVEDPRGVYQGRSARGRTSAAALSALYQCVGLVRGLIHGSGARIVLVSPQAAKAMVMPRGARATKKQVAAMVRHMVNDVSEDASEHVTDAIAVALAGARMVTP